MERLSKMFKLTQRLLVCAGPQLGCRALSGHPVRTPWNSRDLHVIVYTRILVQAPASASATKKGLWKVDRTCLVGPEVLRLRTCLKVCTLTFCGRALLCGIHGCWLSSVPHGNLHASMGTPYWNCISHTISLLVCMSQ